MTLRDLTLRARALFRPRRVEQELQDELAFHIERETKKLIDDGLAPVQARQRAQARFGSPTLTADECRDERGTAFIDNTIADIRYALRTFRRAPLAAFTGFCSLSHFYLYFLCVYQIVACNTEPARRNLFDCAVPRVASRVRNEPVGYLAALARVALASDPVHGDG